MTLIAINNGGFSQSKIYNLVILLINWIISVPPQNAVFDIYIFRLIILVKNSLSFINLIVNFPLCIYEKKSGQPTACFKDHFPR